MPYEAHAMWHSLELAGAVAWFDLPAIPGSRRELFGGVLAAFAGVPPSLSTSVWSGPVTIDLTVHEMRPEVPSGDSDVVVEASVRVKKGLFGLRGPEDTPSLVDEYGVWLKAGWVRMRVAGSGRDVAYDEAVDTAVEHYVVQVWSEQPSATVDLATGERVQRPGPVEPATDPGVRVEAAGVVGLDGMVRPCTPRRSREPGRGPIRG